MSTVIAGPFATSFLAEHGAEIIKIEPPEGDILRRAGRAPEPGMSSIFQHINRGKRSIVLDLKQQDGRNRLCELLRDADALVFNFRKDAMKRLGLSLEEVRSVNENLIYFSVTGFGSGGRYAGLPAYDDIIQGMTGLPDLMARATGDGVPRYVPMAIADRVVGLYAAVGLLVSLLGKKNNGQGAAVEVPMFETMAHFTLVEHMFLQSFEPPLGASVNPRVADTDRRPYKTKDGFICVLPYTDRNWRDIFRLSGHPSLADDDRFRDFASRMANANFLHKLLQNLLQEKTTNEWVELLSNANISAMPMKSIDQLLADEHLKDVGFFRLERERMGHRFISMKSPICWHPAGAPASARAPLLGEHTTQVPGAKAS